MRIKLAVGSEEKGWLIPEKPYPVVGLYGENGSVKFRVWGEEECSPAFHESTSVEVIDPSIPSGWVITIISPSSWEISPKELAKPDFWDRFFDGDPEAISSFNEALQTQC